MSEQEMMKNSTPFSLVTGPLTNRCLVAVPNMGDTRFESSVIYICSHSDKDGAKGFVLNKPAPVAFKEVLSQLSISDVAVDKSLLPSVLWGGPMEQIRGYILHTNDYSGFETTAVTDTLNLTASIDVLSEIAKGTGPKEKLLFLGYTSWSAGQLELEIAGNSWFAFEADEDFLFHCPVSQKWRRALSFIGVDPLMLSLEQGSA